MAEAKLITAALRSTPELVRLSLSLAWTYFTLNWRVGRARRTFEKQLIAQGLSKQDAHQLSSFLEDFKNSITTTVRHGLARGGFR